LLNQLLVVKLFLFVEFFLVVVLLCFQVLHRLILGVDVLECAAKHCLVQMELGAADWADFATKPVRVWLVITA